MDMPQTLTINHQLYTVEQMRSPGLASLQVTDKTQSQTLVQNLESGQLVGQAGAQRTGKSWLQQHFLQQYGAESFEVQLADFLAEWFAPSDTLIVQTSGSTGTPKKMQVSKEKMLNSARLTVEFLGLKPGDQAHLCMPLQYIAGKMVVVRALLAGLDLIVVKPSGRPLQGLTCSPEFSAMIPMQVYNTLQAAVQAQAQAQAMSQPQLQPQAQTLIQAQAQAQSQAQSQALSRALTQNKLQTSSQAQSQKVQAQGDDNGHGHEHGNGLADDKVRQAVYELELLRGIKQLIIGGGSVDEQLGAALKDFPHAVWSTYGMTETLSHIALRRLNGKDASEWYTPFAHVALSLSKEHTLVIDAPLVADGQLVTNDIVEFNEQGQFRILGRKDNTINTGGVKVQIEQVESALKPLLPVPFMITSRPDPKFGQIVVMLVDTSSLQPQSILESSNAVNGIGLNAGTGIGSSAGTGQSVAHGMARGHNTQDRLIGKDAGNGIGAGAGAVEAKVSAVCKLTLEQAPGLWAALEKALATLPQFWRPKLILQVAALPQTGTGKPDRASAARLAAAYQV